MDGFLTSDIGFTVAIICVIILCIIALRGVWASEKLKQQNKYTPHPYLLWKEYKRKEKKKTADHAANMISGSAYKKQS